MPRVAYPNEVGISDPDIIEIRISTAKKRGKSTRKDPNDHILAVRHRIFGWIRPWEWGTIAKIEKAIDKVLELVNSFLRTEVGVIVFVLGGSLTILYLFLGEKFVKIILGLVYTTAALASAAFDTIKNFITSLASQIPGFPEIPPLDLPPIPGIPDMGDPGENIQPGFEEETVTSNFVDAVYSLFRRLLFDPLFGFGRAGPFIPGT